MKLDPLLEIGNKRYAIEYHEMSSTLKKSPYWLILYTCFNYETCTHCFKYCWAMQLLNKETLLTWKRSHTNLLFISQKACSPNHSWNTCTSWSLWFPRSISQFTAVWLSDESQFPWWWILGKTNLCLLVWLCLVLLDSVQFSVF